MSLGGDLVALYGTLGAVGIVVWWSAVFSRKGETTHGQANTPHLAAELLTAVTLLASGLMIFFGIPSLVLQLTGLGMLTYATVNAIGLVARENKALVFGLAAEAALTMVIIGSLAAGYIPYP